MPRQFLPPVKCTSCPKCLAHRRYFSLGSGMKKYTSIVHFLDPSKLMATSRAYCGKPAGLSGYQSVTGDYMGVTCKLCLSRISIQKETSR